MRDIVAGLFTRKYSRPGLWSLFLVCAFPLHVWTIILFLRDVGWVSERTNLWDAIGVGAYGLILAFVESVLVFLAIVALGWLLTPPRWAEDRRISFLSLVALIVSIWAIIGQSLFLWKVYLPASLMDLLIRSGRPLVGLYLMSLAIVVPTVLLPVYQFLRSDRLTGAIRDFSERLSFLMIVYLFLDLAGLIIILVRNLS